MPLRIYGKIRFGDGHPIELSAVPHPDLPEKRTGRVRVVEVSRSQVEAPAGFLLAPTPVGPVDSARQ